MHAPIAAHEDIHSIIITLRIFISAVRTEYPDGRPQLWTDHDRYEPGDVLRANCSSPPSRPRVELRLALNNIVVSISSTQNTVHQKKESGGRRRVVVYALSLCAHTAAMCRQTVSGVLYMLVLSYNSIHLIGSPSFFSHPFISLQSIILGCHSTCVCTRALFVC